MKSSGLLQWRDTPNGYGPIAQVTADFAVDVLWRVGVDGGYLEKRISAAVLTVDNSANDETCTVTINGIATLCSANVRTNFPVPRGISFFDITAPSGQTTLNFYADRRDVPPDLPNFAAIIANTVAAARLSNGNCVLGISGANLILSPHDGNSLLISGTTQTIPSTSVILVPPGLAFANTLLFIYAFMNGSVMTLEADATGRTTDPTTGIEIKLGDPSRTLVGMAQTDAAGLWVNTSANRAVRTWYNDVGPRPGFANFLADVSTISPVDVELSASIRVSYLQWVREKIFLSCNGVLTINGGVNPRTGITIDGIAAGNGLWTRTRLDFAGATGGIGISGVIQGAATDGYHFATLVGRSDGVNTATWLGASADERVSLNVAPLGHA